MPTYQFECKNCKQTIEDWYSMSKRPQALVCDKCGEVADHIILGGQGFHLKGSGWAFDRYAGESNFKWGGNTDGDP